MNKRRRLRIDKRKADEAWSKEVRSAGCCSYCGTTNNLDAHHILVKERYPELRHEVFNGICLCKKHHKWHKHSAHKNSIFFAEFLKKHNIVQYNWAVNNL